MTDRYQPLRDAIAAGPTPGPWRTNAPEEVEGQYFVVTMARDGDTRRIVCKVNNFISKRPLEDEDAASAIYIAAADPDTIAALLADHDREKSRADSLAEQVRHDYEQICKLVAEQDALREALHRISLGAQNSAHSKEALGREARAALARPNGDYDAG